ncbi:MAG: SDR family oxidoreductase [Betaproteobacteria bacterium]|nr:MAG: SDR family oxidoreductase [Betaproteobacteria bacterium]
MIIADTQAEDWDRIIRTNLYRLFRMAQAVLPHMRARGNGNMANLSSHVTQRFPAGKGRLHRIQDCARHPGAIRADMPAEALGDPDSDNALAITSPAALRRAAGNCRGC